MSIFKKPEDTYLARRQLLATKYSHLTGYDYYKEVFKVIGMFISENHDYSNRYKESLLLLIYIAIYICNNDESFIDSYDFSFNSVQPLEIDSYNYTGNGYLLTIVKNTIKGIKITHKLNQHQKDLLLQVLYEMKKLT